MSKKLESTAKKVSLLPRTGSEHSSGTATQGLESIYRKAPGRKTFLRGYLDYLINLLDNLDLDVVDRIITEIEAATGRGNTIYCLGNGGSASIASHFANDLAIGTLSDGAPCLRVVSLADNLSILTAVSNDTGYENIFFRQLEPCLRQGDVIIALSVSGDSPNVVKAVELARTRGAVIVSCTGFDGGALRRLSDVCLHVPTIRGEYGPVEDIFMVLDHIIYTYLNLARRGSL